MSEDKKLDVETDAQEVLIRDDFGLKEDNKRVVRDTLTPIDHVTPDLVISRKSFSFLGRDEESKPPTKNHVELALACVKAYREYQKSRRDDGKGLQEWEHYGETTQLIDYVTITPVGPQGGYLVSFTTTHVQGENDMETRRSGLYFDEKVNDIERGPIGTDFDVNNSWLVGKKDGKIQIIGKYEDLHAEAKGSVGDLVKHQGFTNIGKIRPSDLDEHSGWLKPPAPKK